MSISAEDSRATWNSYFLDVANVVSTRSTCIRRHVGAVAVDQCHRIIGTAYNGAPSGMEHCTSTTCYRTVHHIPSGEQLDKCKAIHAEANLVSWLGKSLLGQSVYCTTQPCTSCLKLLLGLHTSIYWREMYNDAYSLELMTEYGTLALDDEGIFSLKEGKLFAMYTLYESDELKSQFMLDICRVHAYIRDNHPELVPIFSVSPQEKFLYTLVCFKFTNVKDPIVLAQCKELCVDMFNRETIQEDTKKEEEKVMKAMKGIKDEFDRIETDNLTQTEEKGMRVGEKMYEFTSGKTDKLQVKDQQLV